ncbi:uncharacterized protein LOC119573485 [Penaeus monodon]|uniref:uncharacterized protein LOC119573485 n=1 Tax=Penaeus monodon TaxID=6687 RepID=UPI0018A7779A|nr:uncharacterized protein LOC119573485 [Penaeus monodon]
MSISQLGLVRAENGRIVSEPGEYWVRWVEYFEQLYRVDPTTSQLPLAWTQPLVADPPVSEAPLFTKECTRQGLHSSAHGASAQLPLQVQRSKQSGFTPKKSTVDRVLALCVLVERRLEFQQGMLAAYVDLKKAFDSVHQKSLWSQL